MFALSQAITSFYAGKVIHRFGPEWAHIISLFVMAISQFGFASSPNDSIYIMCFWRLLEGSAGSFTLNTSYVLVSRLYPNNISAKVAFMEVFIGIAASGSEFFGGLVFEHYGWWTVFSITFTVLFLVFAWSFCCFYRIPHPLSSISISAAHESTRRPLLDDMSIACATGLPADQDSNFTASSPPPPPAAREPPLTLLDLLLKPQCAVIAMTAGVSTGAFSFYDPTLSPHLNEYFGPVKESTVGAVLAWIAFLYTIGTIVAGVVLEEHDDDDHDKEAEHLKDGAIADIQRNSREILHNKDNNSNHFFMHHNQETNSGRPYRLSNLYPNASPSAAPLLPPTDLTNAEDILGLFVSSYESPPPSFHVAAIGGLWSVAFGFILVGKGSIIPRWVISMFPDGIGPHSVGGWTLTLVGNAFTAIGNAVAFVPTVSWMQIVANRIFAGRDGIQEQAVSLVVGAMAFGEALSPLFAGSVMGEFGFTTAASVMTAVAFVSGIIMVINWFAEVVEKRRWNASKQDMITQLHLDILGQGDSSMFAVDGGVEHIWQDSYQQPLEGKTLSQHHHDLLNNIISTDAIHSNYRGVKSLAAVNSHPRRPSVRGAGLLSAKSMLSSIQRYDGY